MSSDKPTKVKSIKGTVECSDFTEIRGTGRSTVIALRLIADAIANPMKWYKVEDHYAWSYGKTPGKIREANRHLMDLIWDIIRNNQFNMELNSQRLRIRSLHLGYKVVNGIVVGKVEPKKTD